MASCKYEDINSIVKNEREEKNLPTSRRVVTSRTPGPAAMLLLCCPLQPSLPLLRMLLLLVVLVVIAAVVVIGPVTDEGSE